MISNNKENEIDGIDFKTEAQALRMVELYFELGEAKLRIVEQNSRIEKLETIINALQFAQQVIEEAKKMAKD